MLLELQVENLAVIERVRVRFHPGLNLLTGETGSGKSIVVDALGLLFGGRASAEMLRSGTQRARVAAIFEVPQTPAFAALSAEAAIETEDGELILEREILASGKSRAFVGGRPVTAAMLRDLAPHLGDIHGQHDQQLLFSVDSQRDMLDDFAGLDIAPVRDLYREWSRLAAALQDLDRNEADRLRLADLWSFQRREIEAANPKQGEDLDLENERRVLKNVARLQELATAAYEALYDAPESAAAQLKAAVRRVEELARIDGTLAGVGDGLKPAVAAVEDASFTLRDYMAKLEADPARLDEVEGRLATIEKLKRKYGATLEEVLGFLETVRQQLGASEDAGDRRARLQKECDSVGERYRAAAEHLSGRRRKAAAQLKKRVEAELKSLAMERTVFEAQIEPAPWTATGADAVRFLISPNPGEEPRPLEKTASGGELSRVALALKTCVAGENEKASVARTLVFDEVDAGVGGGAAEAVGRRLKRLAGASQVLCVTHLPQIAGFAGHHYLVSKREANGRTVAAIEELDPDGRRQEIGRMLSGERVTPDALRHAEQLMRASSERLRE